MTDDDKIALLQRFAAAWNAHDADALVDLMTEDGVFLGAAGPAPSGSHHQGMAALRAAYSAIWERVPDAAWTEVQHFVSGDRGVTEWVFTGTGPDGAPIKVAGCDVFTLQDGRIAIKDTYRKNVT
ncbi:MAG: nuclear transport factor 2 family protein [Pseudomonadota bacterium]